jgi:hypothetical protein
MKNIFKSILVAIVVLGSFTSCEESDLSIDTLYNEVDTTGAALRMLSYPDDLVSVSGGNFSNCMCYSMEVQEGRGTPTPDFKEVRVYFTSYNDQDTEFPTTDADGNEFSEVLYQTISNPEFDQLSSTNNLPMFELSIPMEELITAFPGAQFTIPSFIVTRFELEMNDGRVWSVNNAGATMSGPYFESAFARKTIFLNI